MKKSAATQSEVARVVMLWPAELKAEIQAEVGKRGLTAYVLEAVRRQREASVGAEELTPIEMPVQKCAGCGADLEDGSCWVCDA